MYEYSPSTAAAGIFAALFCITLIYSTYTVVHYARNAKKKEKFARMDPFKSEFELVPRRSVALSTKKNAHKYIPLLVGCLLEVIGYIARTSSTTNQERLMPFIIQSTFVLIAPTLMAASIYMLFGRLLVLLDCTSLSIMPSRHNTTIFVTGDILSFLLQAGGGGLSIKQSMANLGKGIVIAGLIIQLLLFTLFIVTEVRFSWRVKSVSPIVEHTSSRWRFLNNVLLLCSLLILVRSVVRTVEYIQGLDGYINSHEAFLYCFDSIPMLLVVVIFFGTMHWCNIFSVQADCVAVAGTQ